MTYKDHIGAKFWNLSCPFDCSLEGRQFTMKVQQLQEDDTGTPVTVLLCSSLGAYVIMSDVRQILFIAF